MHCFKDNFRVRSSTWTQFLKLVLVKYKHLTPPITHPVPNSNANTKELRGTPDAQTTVHLAQFLRLLSNSSNLMTEDFTKFLFGEEYTP